MSCETAESQQDRGDRASRILIVEEAAQLSRQIAAGLRSMGFGPVYVANDRHEALDLAVQKRPDVALVDVQGEAIGGIAAVRQLHSVLNRPVIVTSDARFADAMRDLEDVGIYGHVVKPLTREALSAAIHVAWRRFCESHRIREEVSRLKQAIRVYDMRDTGAPRGTGGC